MRQESTRSISRIATIATSSIFLFLSILLIASRLTLTDAIPPAVDVILSALAMVFLIYCIEGAHASKVALLSIIFFFAFMLLWAIATSSLYSPGDDEYAYHLTAIWDLANGWNPLTTPHGNIWVDSYPNGYWVLQSYLVATTGLLLSGQSLLAGLIVLVILLASGFFVDQLPKFQPRYHGLISLILAGFVAGNPIVLTQILTHYTDAPLYLLGCALAFFLMTDAIASSKLARWGAISCIILLVNTKTANLYYVPLIVFGGFIMDLVINKTGEKFLLRAFKWVTTKGVTYCLVSIFAVVVIGYKPYVTNLQDHLSLLYPSVTDIMSYNIPTNVEHAPTPVKFLYGIFAETGPTLWPYPFDSQIYLKIPGTFKIQEFKILRFDTRRGGFGPFFSLALITSILAYLSCRLASISSAGYKLPRVGDGIAAFAIVLLAMSMFFPESWWARYVPFTWLSAFLFFFATFFLSGKGKAVIPIRVLQIVALASFFLCIVAGAGGAFKQTKKVRTLTNEIEAIQGNPRINIYIEKDIRITPDHQSSRISDAADVWARLFRQKGINVIISGTQLPDDENSYCQKMGWLEAHVFWCIPAKQNM